MASTGAKDFIRMGAIAEAGLALVVPIGEGDLLRVAEEARLAARPVVVGLPTAGRVLLEECRPVDAAAP